MKILVIGGAGFLGRNLIEALQDSHDVLCLDTKMPDEQWRKKFNVNCEVADVSNKISFRNFFKDVDIVYHLAALLEKPKIKKEFFWKVNFEGVKNSFELAKENNAKQFIYASTGSIGGPHKGFLPNEDSPYFAQSEYQKTKVESEKFLSSQEFPVTIIRPELAYGPGDMHHLGLYKAINGNRFFFIGTGEIIIQPTFFSDIVQGFLLVLNNQKAFRQKYIIAGDDMIPIRDFIEEIALQLDKKISPFFIPSFAGRAAGYFGDFAEKIGIKFPLRSSTVNFFLVGNAYDNSKAKEELGFKPQVGFKEGIAKTVEWYREKNIL